MNAPLRIGLIGLGVISRYYLAAFEQVPGVELIAVCDVREDRLAACAGTHRRFADHHTMLAEADLDAVIVNVPNDIHAQLCSDAIRAGVAVCVEKPLATDLDDARRLCAEAKAARVTLFTAFHRRYNSHFRALVERGREHGAVRAVRAHYDELIEDHIGDDNWYLDMSRCGGGCVADNGPNAIDTVRMFLPELSLTGADIRRDSAGVDRWARLLFDAPGGASAEVLLDWAYHGGERKDVEVTYADGTVLYADALAGVDEFKGSLWHEYAGILADFAARVRTGDDYGDDGLIALELVTAAYRAAEVERVR